MQAVTASCAGDPSVPARAEPPRPPAPSKRKRRGKYRKPIKLKSATVGLDAFQEQRLRALLRGNGAPLEDRDGGLLTYTCSEPWVDAQVRSFEDVDADGERIVYRFFDPHAFPPGGPKTGMQRCRGCGRVTPPQNVGSSGHCDDCRYAGMSDSELARLPKSPGVIDMGRLKGSRRRGEEVPS